MDFHDALKKLEHSEEFKAWRKEDKKPYLAYGFIMSDPTVKEEWQIGYYSPDNDKVTTFVISEKITKNPEAEALKDEKELKALDPDKVKIKLSDALKETEKLQKEKYKSHTPFKKIILLQNLDIGLVWNITYVTNTFKTLNIKIDAETGKIVKDELLDLFRIEK